MGIYKLNGGSPIEAWNALIEDVNELVPECPGIDELELKEAPHLWAKEDIQEVEDKLNELCPQEFEPIPDLWKKEKIDELIEAIEQGTCCCEDEIIEFQLEPAQSFCPNRFFGGRTNFVYCIGKEVEALSPFEEKFWGGTLSIGFTQPGTSGGGHFNASVEFGIQIPIGCAGEVLWQGEGFYVPFFSQVKIASAPEHGDPATIKLYLYCPFSTSLMEPNPAQGALWAGDFFAFFGDEADQCCSAIFGACNQTCPFPCTRNTCDKTGNPDPTFDEVNCEEEP